ncbi:ATP-binding protein [Halomonas sp. HMF6819]|uniref:ATP-binding protein n=1 Tax=Halomonas sp. HMF6819 TaxID=3373085 RepID=UPI003791DB60
MQQPVFDAESANLFSLISHQALLLLDTSGTIRLGSRGAWKLLGVERHIGIGTPLCSLLPLPREPDDSDGCTVAQLLSRAREAAEQDSSYQYRTEREGIWLDIQIEYLPEKVETPDRFIVSVENVTTAHQAQAQLKESLRMLNDAEQKAGLGHWRLMLSDQSIIWSRGVYNIHGFEEGSDVSLEEVMDAYLPDDRQRVNQLLAESVARKEGTAFKASIRRPDGVFRAVDVQWNIELDKAQQPVSVFGVIHDCTQENTVTRQLIAARDEALAEAQANKMLLATMSHEIRTPLAGIIGMLDALLVEDAWVKTTFDLKENFKRLRAISSASKSLMATLDDVLDHTKIESGHFQLDDFEFDLADVINGTADLFQPSVIDKKLSLERSVIGPVDVVGDPKRIQQIVANFLSNAVKFTLQGFIKVSLSEEPDGQLLIEVADSGVGIAEEDQKKLFTPFQQADDSIYSRFGGTGLGLSICRSLAEAMEGSLGVKSKPDVGSCFWVRLPLRRVKSQKKASDGKMVLPLIGSRAPHVLVVDDNKTNVLIAEGMLRAIGGTCEEAENGLDALETLLTSSFDAVLLDSSMPVMDGERCIELIRQLPEPLCRIPVIAYTAHRQTDVRETYLAATFDAILEKPLSREKLYTTLNYLFGETTPPCSQYRHELPPDVRTMLSSVVTVLEESDPTARIRFLESLQQKARDNGDQKAQALFGFLTACVATLNQQQVLGLLRAIDRRHALDSGASPQQGEGQH